MFFSGLPEAVFTICTIRTGSFVHFTNLAGNLVLTSSCGYYFFTLLASCRSFFFLGGGGVKTEKINA